MCWLKKNHYLKIKDKFLVIGFYIFQHLTLLLTKSFKWSTIIIYVNYHISCILKALNISWYKYCWRPNYGVEKACRTLFFSLKVWPWTKVMFNASSVFSFNQYCWSSVIIFGFLFCKIWQKCHPKPPYTQSTCKQYTIFTLDWRNK